jgi:hypothetical protein
VRICKAVGLGFDGKLFFPNLRYNSCKLSGNTGLSGEKIIVLSRALIPSSEKLLTSYLDGSFLEFSLPRGRPGFVSRLGHVSPGTSRLV